jgi:hypothetical protein
LVLAALATLAVSSEVRDAVAGFFGLAVEGERIEVLPTPPPGVTPTPLPTPPPLESIGTPATLEGAATALGFGPHLPPGAGEPGAIFLLKYESFPAVVFRYPSFDLWEFRTDLGVFLGKGVGNARFIEAAKVRGADAYWIEGGVRVVSFVNASGTPVTGSTRTVTEPSLVWARDGVYYRIETTKDRPATIALAESIP